MEEVKATPIEVNGASVPADVTEKDPAEVSTPKSGKKKGAGSPKKEDNRKRNFACTVYPESAPADWLTILESQFVPAFVSPLHDRDINPTGEPKKAHWHVIYAFQGKQSDDAVRNLFTQFGGVGLEKVKDLRAYARYLCHLDNPSKAQYRPEDVKCFGGADYFATISLTADKYTAIGEMMDYVTEHDIRIFARLFDYARQNRQDWFRALCDSSTMVMKEYIKSRAYELREWENEQANRRLREYTEALKRGFEEAEERQEVETPAHCE